MIDPACARSAGDRDRLAADHGDDPASPSVPDDRPGRRCRRQRARRPGSRTSSINEHYFQGHFPTRPVMPGVLIIEAMAQTAAVLVVHTLGPECGGQAGLFHERRQRPFPPPGRCPATGSHVHVTKQRNRGNVWKFEGRGQGRRTIDGRSRVRRDDPGRLGGTMPQIHPTAIVEPGARLADDVVDRPLLRRSARMSCSAPGSPADRMS